MKGSMEERFWAKVNKTDSCWEWTASLAGKGYGQFRPSIERGAVMAHRISWEIANGPIPAGMAIDHTCFNKRCVNPSHLRLATTKQNGENYSDPLRADNTSGVRGVYWHKSSGKWNARVQHHGKTHSVGTFADIKDAEAAVIAKRNELFTHNDLDRAA